MRFPQVMPASITPFESDGKIDFLSLARHISYLEVSGCTGIVLAGTNGEGVALSAPEKRDLLVDVMRFQDAVRFRNSLNVFLGVATNSISEAIWLCKQVYREGASGVLLMPPFFYRGAPVEGIERWFLEVLDESPAPILLYHHPKQTGITFEPEMLHRLNSHFNLMGLKDSSANPEHIVPFRQALSEEKLLLTGCEPLLLESLAAGWTGTISGAANLVPQWLSEVARLWVSDREQAEIKFEVLLPVLESIRSYPQPASNKAVLRAWGILNQVKVRPPLENPDVQAAESLRNLLREKLGLEKDKLGVRTIA